MNLFITNLLSFLWPQILEQRKSVMNGIITVDRFLGRNRIIVKRFWQSGTYMEGITIHALTNLKIRPDKIVNVLLLGVGGGSAIHIIHKYFPKSNITGVEIDSEMLSLRQKYFDTDEKSSLKLINNDANKFVLDNCQKLKFDLIFNDLYIGCDMPQFAYISEFLTKIKSMLNPYGVYICNASYTPENQKKTDEMIYTIKKIFPEVETILKKPNMIIRAYTIKR
jgi:spermidine synthase